LKLLKQFINYNYNIITITVKQS